MWEIISNPVTLSVIVMCVLCLCKLNVILSLLVSAMVAGFAAGMGPGEIMGGIITGLNGNGTNAIAYLLLGRLQQLWHKPDWRQCWPSGLHR